MNFGWPALVLRVYPEQRVFARGPWNDECVSARSLATGGSRGGAVDDS